MVKLSDLHPQYILDEKGEKKSSGIYWLQVEKYLQQIISAKNRVKWIYFIPLFAMGIALLIGAFKYLHLADLLGGFQKSSDGIIRGDLLINFYLFSIVVVSSKLSGLSLSDIGLSLKDIKHGVLITSVYFILFNVIAIILSIVFHKDILIEYDSIKQNANYMICEAISQFFGNALFEEVFWRGFLLVQLAKVFHKITKKTILALAVSAIIGSVIFAYGHSHGTGFQGLGMERSFALIISGISFCVMYLLFNNIFSIIGIHAITNISYIMSVNGFVFIGYYHGYISLVLGIILAIYYRKTRNKPI